MKRKIFSFIISFIFCLYAQAQTKEFKIYGSQTMDFMEHNKAYFGWFDSYDNMDYYQTYYFYDSTFSNVPPENISIDVELDEKHIITSELDPVTRYTKYTIKVTWHPNNIYYFDGLYVYDLDVSYYDKQGVKHKGYIEVKPPKAHKILPSPISDDTSVVYTDPFLIMIDPFVDEHYNYFPNNYFLNYGLTSYCWMKSTDGMNWTRIDSNALCNEYPNYTVNGVSAPKTYYNLVTFYYIGDYELNKQTESESSHIITFLASNNLPLSSGNATFTKTNTTTCSDPINAGEMTCSLPSGGSDLGNYTYQWQKSTDNINWQNISGATNSTYNCAATITYGTTYFRCQSTCAGVSVYSNTVTVVTKPLVSGSALFTKTNTTTSNDPANAGEMKCTAASGGLYIGNYTYQWQRSIDYSIWQDIPGAASLNYNCAFNAGMGTTYYRCKTSCGTELVYSNAVTVSAGIQNTAGNLNYMRTWTAQSPISQTTDLTTNTNPAAVISQTQYNDAFGRPVETIIRQAGTNKSDMVTMQQYDELGREAITYLPYASDKNDGFYKNAPLYEQQYFYKNTLTPQQPALAGEETFYGKTEYEASPLSRVAKAMAPGNSWAGSGKGTEIKYLFNNANDHVWLWTITNNAPGDAANIPASITEYVAGQLYKTVTLDEQGSAVVEYKDKEGRLILKKVQAGSIAADYSGYTGFLCTYYVYDYLSQLRFTMQPKAVEWLLANNKNFGATGGAQVIAELCFRYEYDAKQRLISKKVPGADWVYMVYDMRDRLVFAQDANMRSKQQWMTTFYDNLNRPVETALVTTTYTREALQNYVNGIANVVTSPSQGTGTLAGGGSFTIAPLISQYPVPAGATVIPLTLTCYDNYDNTAKRYNTTNNSKLDAGSSPYPDALPAAASTLTRDRATVTKTRILQDVNNPATGNWLETAVFYDDKGRAIQVQSTNYKGGLDITTTRYDFSGKLISTYTVHNNGSGGITDLRTKTNMDYDHAGRIVQVSKTINDDQQTKRIVDKNDYDALGQLKKKTLGSGSALEGGQGAALSYDYNIRGWLTGMNKDFVKGSPTNGGYFGYEMAYDKATSVVPNATYIHTQYNGNISGITWKSKGDYELRKYDFDYDKVNRLTAADFNQYSAGSFNKTAGVDFSVSNLGYDANGNILGMNQKGLKGTGSNLIDQLSYTYAATSNKLLAVSDAIGADNKLGDFTDKNTIGDDYAYNTNGSLIQDKNKNIEQISYNHLGLPAKLTVTGKGTISYIYDAAGARLEKIVNETAPTAKTTTTTYLGNYVYQNNALQFFGQEEGRVRPVSLPLGGPGWAFDYFLKDHLGNVRMVLTDEQKTDAYPALTFETATKTTEVALYENADKAVIARPAAMGDATANGSNVQLLRKSTQAIGGGKLLKVMSGDKLNAKVDYYISAGATDNATANGLSSVLTSLTTLIDGGAASAGLKGSGTTVSTNLNNTAGFTDLLRPQSSAVTEALPKAYLNVLFFDEQFKFVGQNSVITQVNVTGSKQTIIKTGIEAPKNGYAYIYVNNESNNLVYFDNLQLTHIRGAILEENHYYPFGLAMAGISSKSLNFGMENRYKFNGGVELNSDMDINLYETAFRGLDPQIGRFHQVDPLADAFDSWSPYTFAFDNPVHFNDPLGLSPQDSIQAPDGEWVDEKGSMEPVVVTAIRPWRLRFDDPWGDPWFDKIFSRESPWENQRKLNEALREQKMSWGGGGGGNRSVLDTWGNKVNTGMGALATAMTAQSELMGYAVRSSFKSAQSWGEFSKLRPTQQVWREVAILGKEGQAVLKTLKTIGYVGGVVSIGYSFADGISYYNNGGSDWKVGAKSGLDIAMTYIGFLGPIGFGISATYFVLNMATDSFGGFGKH